MWGFCVGFFFLLRTPSTGSVVAKTGVQTQTLLVQGLFPSHNRGTGKDHVLMPPLFCRIWGEVLSVWGRNHSACIATSFFSVLQSCGFHFVFSCHLPVTQGQMDQVYNFRIVQLENMSSVQTFEQHVFILSHSAVLNTDFETKG